MTTYDANSRAPSLDHARRAVALASGGTPAHVEGTVAIGFRNTHASTATVVVFRHINDIADITITIPASQEYRGVISSIVSNTGAGIIILYPD